MVIRGLPAAPIGEARSPAPSVSPMSAVDSLPTSGTPGKRSYVQHPTLWLEDGNITLISSQPGAQGFRVHQSMLAMHSAHFADLLKLPPADHAASKPLQDRVTKIKNCQYTLTNCSAYDLSCFLQFSYDRKYALFQGLKRTVF